MKKLVLLTIISSLLLAGIAFAQPGFGKHKGMKPNGPMMILKMADKLELTDAQTEQLKTMATEFKIEQIDLRSKIEKEEVLMHSLMGNDDVSENEVFAKIDKISALKAESKKMQFKHKSAVDKVLTSDQKAKLKEMHKNRRFNGPRDGFGRRGDCDHPGGCDQGRQEGMRRGERDGMGQGQQERFGNPKG